MKNSIIEEAVSLPYEKRAELVDILMQSLNSNHSEKIDQLWIKEAERRYGELKEGKARALDADEVFTAIHKRLSQ